MNDTETTIEIVETAETPLPESIPASTRQRTLLLAIAAIIIILDQFTKYIVEATLPLYRAWEPIPAIASFFRISHVSNTGTAFGLFPSGSSFFTWAAVIVAIGIIIYNYTLPSVPWGVRLALGLQLGGALGNLIDRIRSGYVTDFLDFGSWPVFNMADMSIVGGAILLAWLMWQEERQQWLAAKTQAESDDASVEIVNQSSAIDEWSTN